MKKIIILIVFLLAGFSIQAQDYQTGIGLRFGLANGLSVKHFLSDATAVEGILTTRWEGFMVTGLFQVHNQLSPQGLSWYYGAGAHLGFFGGYDDHPWFDDDRDYMVLGIDGVIGLEYVFSEIPLSISLDWKPAINLSGHSGFWGDDGGLAVRYVF